MKSYLKASAAALALAFVCGPALAADLQTTKPPTKKTPPAPAPVIEPFDPFLIRVKAMGVVPDGKGKTTSSTLNGMKIDAGDSVVPELELSYFFTKNWAVEAICCLTRNAVKADSPVNETVAHAWLFPPTVLAQYHFTDFGAFKPYVGVGVNYTHYFDVKTDNALTNTTMKIDDSWGVAGQVGFDYMIDRHWGFNFDVKRIYMQPSWKDNDVGLRGNAHIDPWLIGGGVTYRFGGPETSSAVSARY